jgi:enamine deaminase RidA (YjgF/YER057c/UK114 family)
MSGRSAAAGSRQRFSSGGPWEERYGYSRAVRVEDRIVVSGCTAAADADAMASGDAAAQAHAALRVGLGAVEGLGGSPEDVIRTRMYITRREDADEVGAVHGATFAAAAPAATMVIVAGLIDPQMVVEIELEAVVS